MLFDFGFEGGNGGVFELKFSGELILFHLSFGDKIFEFNNFLALNDLILDDSLLFLYQVVRQPLDLPVLLLLFLQQLLILVVALPLPLQSLLSRQQLPAHCCLL